MPTVSPLPLCFLFPSSLSQHSQLASPRIASRIAYQNSHRRHYVGMARMRHGTGRMAQRNELLYCPPHYPARLGERTHNCVNMTVVQRDEFAFINLSSLSLSSVSSSLCLSRYLPPNFKIMTNFHQRQQVSTKACSLNVVLKPELASTLKNSTNL